MYSHPNVDKLNLLQTVANAKTLNNFVDEVFCISNFKGKRYTLVQDRLAAENIKVTMFDAVMLKEDPAKGCWKSHRKIWKESLKKNYKRICIFEDDVLFRRHLTEVDFNKMVQIFNKEWLILYLGHRPLKTFGTEIDGILRCNSNDTHAYILNCKYIPKLLKYKYIKTWFNYGSIDCILSFQDNCYAFYPMICVQDNSLPSDISSNSGIVNVQADSENKKDEIMYSSYAAFKVFLHQTHFEKGEVASFSLFLIPFAIFIIIFIKLINN